MKFHRADYTDLMSESPQATLLSKPCLLPCGATLPNRFVKAAMSEQLGNARRNPTRKLAALYARWSKGGAGLLITGNIMVDRSALGEPQNVVLDAQSDLERFQDWTRAGTTAGNEIWAQLNHPGKQSPSNLSPSPVAPSAVALQDVAGARFNKPRALEEEEIYEIVGRFALSAKLSKQAGFKGVQIHGAHGYLVNQFLSPHHNRRTDDWGGSLENRMRFLLSIYLAMRAEVGPDFPIGLKLNSADFQKGGFSEDDAIEVAQAMVVAGIDMLEISGGTYEAPTMLSGKDSTRAREAYFLDFAEKLRTRVDIPLAVTGGFRTRAGMDAALDTGACDLIGLARSLIIDPDLPNHALANPDHSVQLSVPKSGIAALDGSGMLPFLWYERQIHRLADGLNADTNMSIWRAIFWALKGAILNRFRRRRA